MIEIPLDARARHLQEDRLTGEGELSEGSVGIGARQVCGIRDDKTRITSCEDFGSHRGFPADELPSVNHRLSKCRSRFGPLGQALGNERQLHVTLSGLLARSPGDFGRPPSGGYHRGRSCKNIPSILLGSIGIHGGPLRRTAGQYQTHASGNRGQPSHLSTRLMSDSTRHLHAGKVDEFGGHPRELSPDITRVRGRIHPLIHP